MKSVSKTLFISVFAIACNSFAMADPEKAEGEMATGSKKAGVKPRPDSPDRTDQLDEAMHRMRLKRRGIPYKSLKDTKKEKEAQRQRREWLWQQKEEERRRKAEETNALRGVNEKDDEFFSVSPF